VAFIAAWRPAQRFLIQRSAATLADSAVPHINEHQNFNDPFFRSFFPFWRYIERIQEIFHSNIRQLGLKRSSGASQATLTAAAEIINLSSLLLLLLDLQIDVCPHFCIKCISHYPMHNTSRPLSLISPSAFP
jgi:hypothetical protein